MKMFDYIFFRVYVFFKKQRDFAPEMNGYLLVSLIQFLTLFILFDIGTMIFDYPMITSKWQAAPFIFSIMAFNWYRYEKKLDLETLQQKWGAEERSKKIIRGLLIVAYLVVSLAIPVLYGMATNGQL